MHRGESCNETLPWTFAEPKTWHQEEFTQLLHGKNWKRREKNRISCVTDGEKLSSHFKLTSCSHVTIKSLSFEGIGGTLTPWMLSYNIFLCFCSLWSIVFIRLSYFSYLDTRFLLSFFVFQKLNKVWQYFFIENIVINH